MHALGASALGVLLGEGEGDKTKFICNVDAADLRTSLYSPSDVIIFILNQDYVDDIHCTRVNLCFA